ncbi:RagB/SusD family nutrient uptake outer membrane protein [Carboxylicivirga sp. N1Y90]|uniref:RagB/SusD family nutrient uptake outer membrane protein n=1 Tax=Carboxylicivirga fragile TaxID=3417571 RepID=UPI003D335486|nr:RagB/SusD family nutrient uptake outer membrane protein [Marinilabiliaceae bacterium N1Y90]
MKFIKYIALSIALSFIGISCNMEEKPLFPSADNLYSSIEGSHTVLNGCYSGMADFNYYGADFMHLTYFSSGLFTSNRDASLVDIIALQQTPSLNFVENVWRASYRVIGRTNDLIENLEMIELGDEVEQNNIIGQAYFLRALTYFNLVRLYGGVPLLTKNPTIETMNQPRAEVSVVYEQIVSDLDKAKIMLRDNATQMAGRPGMYAAHMLLAKVYMTMAGNQTAAQTDYWTKAYDEAIEVYEKYSLVSDYRTLFNEASSNNTAESIFEIQGNVENTLRLHQLFTPSNGNAGRSVWGRIKPNIECYDMHLAKYPDDPRHAATFMTEWTKYAANGNTSTIKTYPVFTNRNNKDKSYPWLDKYYIRETTRSSYDTNMNFVVMRYADLLLMLAEIENELNGPDNAYQYVNLVLERARNSGDVSSTEPADWSGLTQEQFRADIMFEYRYELLGEGHEWFNDRRRGYEYFKTNVIDVHNNHSGYDFSVIRDVFLPDNERNIYMPIPQAEITSNPNVTQADQNPGY